MKVFKDSSGREWQIALTISAMQALKAIDVDLLNPERAREGKTEPLGQEIETSLQLFAEVLWCVLKLQADALNMNESQFWESLDGPTLQAAREAFRQDLSDFFQSQPFRQEFLRKTVVVLTVIGDELAATDVDELVTRMRGNSSTNAPASSGSSPAP